MLALLDDNTVSNAYERNHVCYLFYVNYVNIINNIYYYLLLYVFEYKLRVKGGQEVVEYRTVSRPTLLKYWRGCNLIS